MKIGITGSHSTGKTTLLNVLRSEPNFKHFTFCDEVTRWVKSLGIDINESGSDLSQELIMMKHVYNLHMFDNMITDRTSLDGLVYSYWLHDHNQITSETLDSVQRCFEKTIGLYDYIFFIEPEFELVKDGVRSDSVSFRDEINELFQDIIMIKHIPVIKLTGSVMDRLQQFKTHIQG